MPDLTRPDVPFDDQDPDQRKVVEDQESFPDRPPIREGSPLVDPDRAPGSPEGVPPGPGSPR
ncbi:MAG: hypothetical protein QM767_28635 [Anaeromyxobacter sp.]